KKFKAEVANGDLTNASKLLSEVFALLDIAAKDNVIHKNSADRKKATLAKVLDNAKKA
ncbi:MAG: 30S ribosomal protein S20, partial [Clostridia bacterium]|nr:30S ribosomal protein S20 [Clostridia bacterium]